MKKYTLTLLIFATASQANEQLPMTDEMHTISRSMDVSDVTISSLIENTKGTLVIEFYSPHCGACSAMKPVFESVAEENEGSYSFAKINVAENRAAVSRFGISRIPTIIIFKDGQKVAETVGSRSKEALLSWIQSNT